MKMKSRLRHFLNLAIVFIILNIVKGYPMFSEKGLQGQMSSSKEFLDPTEIQNAMCNVVTDQIKATANATITRQLKGVCHAKEVREQLRSIEHVILREIHKVHRTVQAIAAQNNKKSVIFKYLPNKP